jgi:hypothetical protein
MTAHVKVTYGGSLLPVAIDADITEEQAELIRDIVDGKDVIADLQAQIRKLADVMDADPAEDRR